MARVVRGITLTGSMAIEAPRDQAAWQATDCTAAFLPKILGFLGYDPFGPPRTTFPTQLKAARTAAGYTRRQLAARNGVHPTTVADWERGEARLLEPSTKQLSALFGLSFEPRAWRRP